MKCICGPKRPTLVRERVNGPCFKATAYLVDVPSCARIGQFFAYGKTHTVTGIVSVACELEASKQRTGIESTETELFFLHQCPIDLKEDHSDVFFEFVPPFPL
jgi:hypothetical protein